MTKNVDFNNVSFTENLNNIPNVVPNVLGVPDFYIPVLDLMIETQDNNGSSVAKLNQFFASFDASSHPLPQTYDDFMQALASFVGSPTPGTANFPWLAGLLNNFSSATHNYYAPNPNNNFGTTWYNYLSGQPVQLTSNADWPLSPPSPTDMIAQFKTWFGDFLKNFNYTSAGKVVVPTDPPLQNGATRVTTNYFFQQMGLALADTATLSANKSGLGLSVNGGSPQNLSLPSYQEIYNAFFPNGGQTGFITRLQAFYNEQVDPKTGPGYFIPSQLFAKWTNEMQRDYVKSLNLSGNFIAGESSLEGGNYRKTIILNRIFLLISSMLNTLQRVAAVQAQRLNVFTQWQKAYTDTLAQLPVFLSSQSPDNLLTNKTGDSADTKKDKGDARDELNNQVNFRFRDFMQTNRNLVSDESKAMQSNINQSSDAVSQQANMATSIIQELSTLLGAIYR